MKEDDGIQNVNDMNVKPGQDLADSFGNVSRCAISSFWIPAMTL